MVRIYDTDTLEETARKIFEEFEVNQSCTLRGVEFVEAERKVYAKGKMVLAQLEYLDRIANTQKRGTRGGFARIQRKPSNCIGGYLAHKLFRWSEETLNGEPCVTIWRIQ